MKNRKIMIAAATLALIAAASVGPATAYFTDSHLATAVIPINLADSNLTPHEKVDNMTKTITVENTGNYDVYIRVSAFYGDGVTVSKSSGENWSDLNEGYYYYNAVVKAHESTTELKLDITGPASKQDSFNVVIIEEATKALYNADGTSIKPNWELAIKKVEEPKVEDASNQEPKVEDTTNPEQQPEQSTDNEGGNN